MIRDRSNDRGHQVLGKKGVYIAGGHILTNNEASHLVRTAAFRPGTPSMVQWHVFLTISTAESSNPREVREFNKRNGALAKDLRASER